MLRFRNITATPDDPVDQWGTEGILTAIERGGLVHLRRIAHAVRADPWGPAATSLSEAVALTDDPLAARLAALLEEARGGEKATVARQIRDAVTRSGLSLRRFASHVGTSPARLHAYTTGATTPSAAMYLRILNLRLPPGPGGPGCRCGARRTW